MQILRGLSKVLNDKNDGTESYCITNTSRPLLSIGPKGGKGNRRSYLYIEALRNFEAECKKIDLTEAYKKAKPMYNGRLERTFVLLKEEEGTAAVSGGNAEPLGLKRPPETTLSKSPKRPAMSK